MSLIVDLNRFKVLKCKRDKFARLEFRGVTKISHMFNEHDEIILVNERFEWTLTRPLHPGEVITVELLVRSRWGAPRSLGIFTLGLQLVVSDGELAVTDTLVGNDNQAVPAFVEMDVRYIAPSPLQLLQHQEMLARQQAPKAIPGPGLSSTPISGRSLPGPALPTRRPGSAHSSIPQSSDDEYGLEDIQQKIANLERSFMEQRLNDPYVDIEAGDESRTRRLKIAGKRLLRRGVTTSTDERVVTVCERKRTSPLKSMRKFMRLGKQRPRSDEIAFFDDGAGPSTEPDRPPSQISLSSDEILVDTTVSPAGTPLRKKKLSKKPFSVAVAALHNSKTGQILQSSSTPIMPPPRGTVSSLRKVQAILNHGGLVRIGGGYYSNIGHQVLESTGPSALKAADFQVCVTVIEARQLAGLNMDPVVCIQIGDVRKYTSVKESTNCPYYNEYFVFDFHMPPVMLFDKIITLSVLQARNILRANKLLGSFKLDVGTVWAQPERQFYHKWALLTDPDDVAAGAKGYLKCDISVIGKGDTVKIPPKSEKDEDDIEANLLLPEGVPMERQRARFVVKIYRADGLPKMNYSILANVKRAFTGECPDLVDSYVQVSFAGMTGNTSVKRNCYSPIWDEQIVFTEMFPPLCQRIKIQLRDNDPMHPNVIGTHFIDLKNISNDGEKGFLPTFGPAFVYLYGSTRDYSFLDQHTNLNTGIGEGVSYRGRVLVSIRTEITDNIDCLASAVEVEPTLPLPERICEKNEEFFLFASVYDVNMIDRRLADKPLQFELSIGNAGNSLDGTAESVKRPQDLEQDLDNVTPDTGYWQSTTQPSKAMSSDKCYYYLPYWDNKQCMHVRSIWPDNRRRMYNTNRIANIIDRFEEGLCDVQASVESDEGATCTCVAAFKSLLEMISGVCASYVKHANSTPAIGSTILDVERKKVCVFEVEQVGILTRNLKALITKNSIKDRLRTAFTYLEKLKQLCEDPQHSMPDIFIWMISNGKRLAYQRILARDIIYSDNIEEVGKCCGKMQTIFLKWPGKKAAAPSGWSIPAKIYVYLWLGLLQDKKHFIDGLPNGYDLNSELRYAENLRSNAPSTIFYTERHTFQLRAYIYQARSLIGSDSSGLSDPFAKIIFGEYTACTQVIDETLSPTWDELLVFDDILLFSTMQEIRFDPPTVIVEIFDQDKVGKSEFIGRTVAKPHVKAFEEPYERPYFPPSLEWYEVTRGDDRAGELLAAFELLEIPAKKDSSVLPDLPSPRAANEKLPADANKGPILPVPRGIRPTLSKYRIEVLFWGLRDLKRIHLLTVDRPRVDIECAGNIIYSSVISNARCNPNFSNPIKFVDVELPDQDLYRPPLTIRVIETRSFGRVTLVGTHTINSIHKYIYTPLSKREREAEERKKSLVQLKNVDLRARGRAHEDTFTFENERENCPLLLRERATTSYGSGPSRMRNKNRASSKKRRVSAESVDEDESSKDWWTKYFASVEAMIEEEKKAKRDRQGFLGPHAAFLEELQSEGSQSPRSDRELARRGYPLSPRRHQELSLTVEKKNEVPTSALAKIYPHELEAVPEFEDFKEWLQCFELYRGKKTAGDDSEDDSRVVGLFKGALKVYKWPFPKGIDDHTIMGFDPNFGFFQGVPNNDPIHVLVRVYIVKATDLHPMDMNGKADPYILLHLGSKRISDKENYVSKQLNPVFGKCFEIEATFPQDSMLTIQVFDWDLVGSDDLIGETKIDLENRFYSRHRATCGLPVKYEEGGFNRWRDAMKPTQILAKLCKDGKLEPPIYETNRVKVGRTIFNISAEEEALFTDPNTLDEQLALMVLHRWHEVPRVGTHLVPEHIERRPLYNPNKPGVEQGRLEMWVDMFPMDMPLPGPPLDISPRKPKSYEMRVIIWNTDDVVLEDDEFFTGEKMSDIYVKGYDFGNASSSKTAFSEVI